MTPVAKMAMAALRMVKVFILMMRLVEMKVIVVVVGLI